MCLVFSELTFDQFFATVFVFFYNFVIFVQNLKKGSADMKLPPINDYLSSAPQGYVKMVTGVEEKP